MKKMSILFIFYLLFSGCADRDLGDPTRQNSAQKHRKKVQRQMHHDIEVSKY